MQELNDKNKTPKNRSANLNTEPEIRDFDWSTLSSSLFDVGKIVHRANADVLFACLLQFLEKDIPEKVRQPMTIKEISERIPLGTGGISIYASYQYAMIALFGDQKGRDYFQLNNPYLKKAFTKEANNSTRNINFWKQYLDELVAINPKYLLGDGEKKARSNKRKTLENNT